MCGRFTLDIDERFYPRFRLGSNVISQFSDWYARFNIAPSQDSIIILPDSAENNQAQLMRWGLVPFWAKDDKIGNKMINAKAETLFEKPAFRNAVKRKRCIVPATGFYEWQVQGESKQPYYLFSELDKYLSLAGLYETWKDPETNKELDTFTIITTTPNSDLKEIHDRMPLILSGQTEESIWLDQNSKETEIQEILVGIPQLRISRYAVSKKVNSPVNDDPGLIARI